MRSTKRLLSLLIAVVMIMAMMPMSVLAEGTETTPTYRLTVINGYGDATLQAGDGTEVTAKIAEEGMKFKGWISNAGGVFIDSKNPQAVFTMPANDVTVTAVFEAIGIVEPETPVDPTPAKKYTLLVTSPTGATVTTTPGAGEVAEGTTVSVAVTVTDSTKVLDQILLNGTAITGTTFKMPSRNSTVTATLKAKPTTPITYPLTVVNGSGDGNYTSGTVVTIKADAAPTGKVFDKWTGAAVANSTSATTTITMPAGATTVTATYKDATVLPGRPVISSATVYTNRVSGYATPGSRVQLYRDGVAVGSSVLASSTTGAFTINYNFSNYNYRYYDGYRYRDGYRYYNDDRYYDGSRYYDYYDYYYDFSLIATKDGVSSLEYDLTYYNWDYNWDYNYDSTGYWYNGQWYYGTDYSNKYPIVSSGSVGDTSLSGYNVNSAERVTVKDSRGNTLGSADADTRGEFRVYLNRALVQGEKLTVTASGRNYRDRTTDYTVGGNYYPTGLYSQFTIGSKVYTRNVKGITVTATMDVAPFLQNGRTMLPLRYVAESLDYNVTWNDATRVATFTSGNNTVKVSIDSQIFTVNGVEHRFSTTPITVNGRIMLPVSEIAMALGLTHSDAVGSAANIVWNPTLQTVTIKK